MAAAATPATAAATFRFFAARRLLPTFAVTFDASDFALPPARFAAFFARLADFAMLATACLRSLGWIPEHTRTYQPPLLRALACAVSHRAPAPFCELTATEPEDAMAEKAEVKRRHWADVAVILAGLTLWGFAIWPTPFADSPEVGRLTVWPIYAVAGVLTLAGFLLGQRWQWRAIARVLLFAAAAVLAYGLLTTFRALGAAAWLTVIVPGLLLLLAAPFFGPMPRAAEH